MQWAIWSPFEGSYIYAPIVRETPTIVWVRIDTLKRDIRIYKAKLAAIVSSEDEARRRVTRAKEFDAKARPQVNDLREAANAAATTLRNTAAAILKGEA